MEQKTATVRRAPLDGDRSWKSFALFAGGAGRLDAVVEHAVGPAVELAQPRRWAFVRCVDGRGPHVRLGLDVPAAPADLRAVLTAGVQRAAAVRARPSLLPPPASWRRTTTVAVELVQHGREDATDPLDELSSAVALSALGELGDAPARAAYTLDLMAGIAGARGEATVDGFWKDAARRWTGCDERGRELLARLVAQAGEWSEHLVELAVRQRENRTLAELRARYGAACAGLRDPTRVRHHAHMTANRLGVTPLEEALLALVLDAAGSQLGPALGGAANVVQDANGTPAGPILALHEVSDPGEGGSGVRDVSLHVRRGEIVALIGPRDAGAASVLAMAAGLRRPTGGRAQTPAGAALGLPDSELAPTATVRENVELRLRAAGRPGGADALLADAGLTDHAGTLAADLPRGARRRLAIACALVGDPALLVLDGPTEGLSAVEREAVWELLARRRARGAATLLSTTAVQDALAVADRAGLMAGGRLAALGDPHELSEEHFVPASLHIRVAAEPDRALLEDLPEVEHVEIDERIDHWALGLRTRQPEELRKLLDADPQFADIVDATSEAPT